jgi:hypothetical protein
MDLRPAMGNAVTAAGKEAGQARLPVTRAGRRLDCVVLIAPVHVDVPLEGRGRRNLELVAAPVFNIGDGMDLEILLVSQAGSRRAYAGSFDAATRIADRSWRTFRVPLELAGEEGQALRFRLSGGPQGDLVDDWLAFGKVALSEGSASP